MEGGLEWKLRNGADSDGFLPRKTLDVSIKQVEINLSDSEVAEGSLEIEGRGMKRVRSVASRLGQREPKRSVNVVGKHMLFFLPGFRIGPFSFPFYRHTEGERLLTLLYKPAQLLPTLVRVERTRGEIAFEALR
jgi:hypothetical protein